MTQYLSESEKQRCRELWRTAFPEDSKEFTDYYFEEKVKTNKILAREEDGQIISMLHRNPYQIRAGRQVWQCDYIVGVATAQDHRKKGHMRALLCNAMRDMREDKMPFCFLMPADENIYLPFGFTYISNQAGTVFNENIKDNKKFTSIKVGINDEYSFLASIAAWMQEWLSQNYEVYTVRDAEYVRSLLKELSSENGYLEIFYRGQEIAGAYASWGIVNREQRILMGEVGIACEERKRNPLIMGRIIHLGEFVKAIRLKHTVKQEEFTLFLRVIDPLLKENDGVWCWRIYRETSRIFAEEHYNPDITITIHELTAWLFGYRIPEQADVYKDIICVLNGVFLDEVV